MIILTTEEVINLHNKLVDKTGGIQGVRDISLLESALYSANATFDDTVYPTVEEKAARLMFSLTNNHAFLDGNKRIGVFTMLLTLKLNNIKLKYTQRDLIALGISTASGEMNYEDILQWINEYKI